MASPEILPYTGKEEIDVINVVDLFQECRQLAHKSLLIVIKKDIQVNSMSTACRERFRIVAAG